MKTMTNLSTIQKESASPVVTFQDHATPAGYFGAIARILGINTTYLLEGEEWDEDARIVGRVELQQSSSVGYRGEGLKGGYFLGCNKYFEDFFSLMVPEPAAAQASARTSLKPGVYRVLEK